MKEKKENEERERERERDRERERESPIFNENVLVSSMQRKVVRVE